MLSTIYFIIAFIICIFVYNVYKHILHTRNISNNTDDDIDSRTLIDSIDIKREKQDKDDFMSKYNIDKDAINDLLDEVLEMNKKQNSLI